MMKNKKRAKKIILCVISILLVAAIGLTSWWYFGAGSDEPVFVYDFSYIGMTEYWGDTKETYGPVSSDNIQTVYLSSTQTVTEVLVQPGDAVKKGDVLMTFDTSLSDLSLERKRLDVEKLKLQLEDAKERLWEINCMEPMVIPEVDESPEEVNLGTALNGDYAVGGLTASDGSTKENAMICWLRDTKGIDDALLEALRQKASELQTKNQPAVPVSTTPPAETTAPPETTAPAETTAPSETTAPTEAAQSTQTSGAAESTQATESTQPQSTGSTEPATPSAPAAPAPVDVNSYYVIFKVTEGNMSLGRTATWQGVFVSRDGAGGFTFTFFDASGIPDTSVADPNAEEDDSEIYIGSGFTAAQIAQMRADQEKTIKDLEFSIKMAEAEYKIMQTEVNDGNIYAEFDGEVVSLLTEEEAKLSSQPFMKVSGGGGFYVEGSVSELDKDTLQLGQEVTVNDWNTGSVYTGIIDSIGDYPTGEDGWYGTGNPNVSYYPFTVFIDGEADFMEYSYVSVMYSSGEVAENGIYLENPFLRTENGKSYLYVQGSDGKLEKRFVTTGKALWGSYTEILSGLSETDRIAFPYGKNVTEGAETVEGDMSDLYG